VDLKEYKGSKFKDAEVYIVRLDKELKYKILMDYRYLITNNDTLTTSQDEVEKLKYKRAFKMSRIFEEEIQRKVIFNNTH